MQKSAKPGRVLIVDDEMNLCRGLARRLRDEFEVVIANDGVEALERIEEGERFHAIACDVMMRAMSGPSLRDAIVRLEPFLALRMIFMTGHAGSELCKQVRNHYIIEKPFDHSEFRALIRRVVDAARDGYFPRIVKPTSR